MNAVGSLILTGSLFMGAGHLVGSARAQGGGGPPGFDPEEFRQRMMERFRDQMEVKDDGEWKIIETRIQKVMEARMAGGGFGAGMGGPRGGGPGRGPGGMGQGSPEGQALMKALEEKSPAEVIKAKLAQAREARKLNEAKIERAQEELKQVLSVRQEAVAFMMGLVK